MPSPEFHLPEKILSASPKVGLILGSGLGSFIDSLSDGSTINYDQIEGLPPSTVPGHAGRLHLGSLGGINVAVAV